MREEINIITGILTKQGHMEGSNGNSDTTRTFFEIRRGSRDDRAQQEYDLASGAGGEIP